MENEMKMKMKMKLKMKLELTFSAAPELVMLHSADTQSPHADCGLHHIRSRCAAN
jgi:hypothetical protein